MARSERFGKPGLNVAGIATVVGRQAAALWEKWASE